MHSIRANTEELGTTEQVLCAGNRNRQSGSSGKDQVALIAGAVGCRAIPQSVAARYRDRDEFGSGFPAFEVVDRALGLTPADVIDLATRRAAEALHCGHMTGTLPAG